MANYTSTIRYRDPYRDPPVYTSSYHRPHHDRPIHIIDSSSISDTISTDSTIITRERHGDRLSDDLLNNPLTRRVLPALLSRSNDADGRPVKVVMNYGNLYLDDSAADAASSHGYSSGHRRKSAEQPNTIIYNAPGSTMAISASPSTGRSLLRPPSPLVRTVSPSDRFSSPERPRLPYRDTHFGQSGSGYYRDTYHGSRSRSHSRDRYGTGREQRRITYYEPSPPSPTYSSLSTITSSTMSASPPGHYRMSGANGPGHGVVDMIDRRPMAMCLGCFKTMRVCSSGYCAACDFFPGPSSGARGRARDTHEREIVIERERDRTPTRMSKAVTYGVGGGGGAYKRSTTYVNDDLATRRIRGLDIKGLDSRFKGLSVDGRKSRSRERGREREIEFDVEIERGRDRNRDAVRELENDRFRAKERAWERVEREKRALGGGLGKKGGPAGYGTGGVRARKGNGNVWDYSSDSDF